MITVFFTLLGVAWAIAIGSWKGSPEAGMMAFLGWMIGHALGMFTWHRWLKRW